MMKKRKKKSESKTLHQFGFFQQPCQKRKKNAGRKLENMEKIEFSAFGKVLCFGLHHFFQKP